MPLLSCCDMLCLQLEKPVQSRGNVEVWLGELLAMQQKSIRGIIREAYEVICDPNFDLLPFLHDYIAQVRKFMYIIYIYIYRSHVCG